MEPGTPNPLLGFGFAGWCLLTVAIALAAGMLAHIDLRFWLLSWINRLLGPPMLMWFVGEFLSSHMFDFPYTNFPGLWLRAMRFGIITMVCALVAMQVQPRVHGWPRIASVVLLGLLVPPLSSMAVRWVSPSLAYQPGSPHFYMLLARGIALSWAGFGVISGVAIGAAMRSWRLGAIVAALSWVGAWLSGETTLAAYTQPPFVLHVAGDEGWFRVIGALWNPMLLGCFLVWAVRARQRTFPAFACQHCGYDLRGLDTVACPECGRSQP